MIVKICGIRTLDDALAAADAGADMLGFNFYSASPRYVDPHGCRRLIDGLRLVRERIPILVGVFVNESPGEIAEIVAGCGLDLIQLSGNEDPGQMARFRGRAFKAIRPRDLLEARILAGVYHPVVRRDDVPAVLLDASGTNVYGGSGQPVDWTIAAALAVKTPVLLAGGLRPGNVAEAIAMARPWGVDVASGVERAPGVKDPGKIAAFIRTAKESVPSAQPTRGDNDPR